VFLNFLKFEYMKVFRITILNFLLFLFLIIIIICESYFLLLSFAYTLLIFIILNSFVFKTKEFEQKNLTVFLLYVIFSILLFWFQRSQIPEWIGFTGPGKLGTDDIKFYVALSKNYLNLPDRLHNIHYVYKDHSYVLFLKYLYPFSINHPLSIIIPNVLGITFIPFFTSEISQRLFSNFKVAQTSYLLTAICPMILTNGLILMRDGWTVFLFVSGIYYMLTKKKIAFIVVLFLLTFIRIASGIFLLFSLFLYVLYHFKNNFIVKRNLFMAFTSIAVVVFIFTLLNVDFIISYLHSKGVTLTGREDFVNIYYSQFNGTVIYSIYSLPLALRLVFGSLFFFFQPFLKFDFWIEGIFNLRKFLVSFIMPIIFLYYYRYFFSALYYALLNHKNKVLYFFIFLVILVIGLSQFSVQARHKTMIMPLYYILIAYGFENKTKNSDFVGLIFTSLIFAVQLIFLIK